MIEAEIQEMLTAMAQMGRPPVEQMTPEMFRASLKPGPADPADQAQVASIEDRSIAGVPTRVYEPCGESRGVMAYFHGGGFVVGNLESCDAAAQAIVARTSLTLVSVDYRLAPEHPFPAAVEDSLAVVATLHEDESRRRGAPLLLAGESAGANLAAVAAIDARDRGVPILHQTLFYPVVDCDFDRPSYLAHGGEAPLTRAAMMWFWDHYAPERQRPDWRACPLHASLAGVAPAFLSLPGHDPLLDEGLAYADALRIAGGEVTIDVRPELVHGFVSFLALSPGSRLALDAACVEIDRYLTRAGVKS